MFTALPAWAENPTIASGTGTNSVVAGIGNTANGANSNAFGLENEARADDSNAMGVKNKTVGKYSNAYGSKNEAYGIYGSAFGYHNILGNIATEVQGKYSTAVGYENIVYTPWSSAFGYMNTIGPEVYSSSNSTGFYSTALGYKNDVQGYKGLAAGSENIASETYSTSVGASNKAYGYGSTAVGFANTIYGGNALAVGMFNTTGSNEEGYSNDGISAAAIGYDNVSMRNSSYVFGESNKSYGENSIVVGYYNVLGVREKRVPFLQGSVFGVGNKAYAFDATAVGAMNIVGDSSDENLGYCASAVGYYNRAYGQFSVAVGAENVVGSLSDADSGMNASAVGYANEAYGMNSVAMGAYNMAYSDYSAALGGFAKTEAAFALAIGTGEVQYDDQGYNIGALGGSYATAERSIAIGYDAHAEEESAIALGTNTSAKMKDSVALGSESVTGTSIPELGGYTYMGKKLAFAGSEPMSVLSVGAEGKERRIINVAAGRINAESTDAINGSQLYSLAGVINSRINDVISGMPKVEAGENITVDVTETPIGGEAGSGTEIADKEDPAEITRKTYTVNGEGGGVATEVKAGKNISSVDLKTAADGHSIYTVNVENMRVTGGSVKYDVKGEGTLSITSGEGAKAVSTEIKGLKNNVTNLDRVNTTLENNTNLKVSVTTKEDGKPVTKESSVDLSDLKTKQGDANAEAIEGLRGSMANQGQEMIRLNRNINKVGAGAAALAGMHPLDYDPHNKLSFSAGIGAYRGEKAAAVGMFYHPNERVMLNLGGTVGNNDNMVSAGINFALDRRVKLENGEVLTRAAQDTLRDKLQLLETENASIKADNEAMKERMAKQEAENSEIKAENADMKARLAKLEDIIQKLAR